MKKIIAIKPFNNNVYYNNACLDEHSKNGSSYLIAARKILAKKNIIMNTIDISTSIPTLRDVYMDVPYPWEIQYWIRIIKNREKSILYIVEPPIVNPFNHLLLFTQFFSKVYTFDDNIVDNVKYFKYYEPKSRENLHIKQTPFKNKKLLILMNTNLSSFLPFRLFSLSTKQLYSERIKVINYFNKNHPLDFCLYGRGWDKPQRFSIVQRLFGYKKYKTYRGEFAQKDRYEILSHFKFSLCFENSIHTGYITEKMIDYFKGGCVPVYFGAPNITDYINSKCFIDYRKFKNLTSLVKFLKTMDEKTYNNYLSEINNFLKGKNFLEKWSSDAFARFFLKSLSL